MTIPGYRKYVQLPSGKSAIIYLDKEPEQLRDITQYMPTRDAIHLLSAYEIDMRLINGQLFVDSAAGSVPREMYWDLWHRGDELTHMVILNQQDKQDMGLEQYNKPIRIFYANLLHHGIKLRVVNGALKVSGNTESLSPVYRDEIIKRAEHLIELLSPSVPEPLEPFFYRLISVKEVEQAVEIAEQMGISLRQTPVNTGWLLEIVNDRVRKVSP